MVINCIKKFLLALVFVLWSATVALAGTLYLDVAAAGCSGQGTADTNYNPTTRSCGSGAGFDQIVYAGNYPYEAGLALNDGDTLYIRAGEYWENVTGKTGYQWWWGSLTLEGKNNVLVKNYNDETVWMKGGPSSTTPASFPNNAIRLAGSNQTVDGINVYGNVNFGGTDNILQNSELAGGWDHQAPWDPGVPDAAWPNVIRFERSINAIVRNCYMHDNVLPPQGGNMSNMSLVMHEEDQNTLVENCKFDNSVGKVAYLKYQKDWRDWQGKPGEGPPGVHTTYRYNVIGPNTKGFSGAPGYSNKTSSLYQNIFIGSTIAGFEHQGQDNYWYIYNNTFYNATNPLFAWTSAQWQLQFFNNIIYHDQSGHYNLNFESYANDFYSNYNDFYVSGVTATFFNGSNIGSSLSTWKSFMQSTGQDQNSLDTNPNFINASGQFIVPEDFKRSSYPEDGRGGSWPAVMGAYITGSEAIGIIPPANVYYVRPGATGNNDGSDWNNAYTSLSTAISSIPRDSTIYIADGSYGSMTFNKATSGSSVMTIKKAIVTDHGTSTGWVDSYGDGSASFTGMTFSTSNWLIDGQVGRWASDLPNFQAYGIRVYRQNTSENQNIVYFGTSNTNNVIIRHAEFYFSNTPRAGTWYRGAHIVRTPSGLSNLGMEFSYCWLHDAGNGIYNGYATDVVFDHSVLERNGQAQVAMHFNPSEHAEIAAIKGNNVDFIIRYSFVRDWRSTGGLIIFQGNSTIYAYGNVFAQTGYYSVPSEANDSDGVLVALTSSSSNASIYTYNNTFANLDYGCCVNCGGPTWVTRTARNNLFYDSTRYLSTGCAIGGSHDYNWFYNSGSQSESNIQNGAGNPFLNLWAGNFRLTSGTNGGDSSIGSTYNADPDGNVRGGDGVWDRGAFEFGGVTIWSVTAQVSGGNGLLACTSPVVHGNTTNCTATPNQNYHTSSISGCGGSWSAGNSYITGAITANCTVTATFAINTHVVTPSAGNGGALVPGSPQVVNHGSVAQFTVVADSGYIVDSVMGCDGALDGGTYTTASITGDCVVFALFDLETGIAAAPKPFKVDTSSGSPRLGVGGLLKLK